MQAAESFPSDQFVAYLMTAGNSSGHGLRDGRYYPYPSPDGFRIAFRQVVLREDYFRDGLAVADAQTAFREQIAATIAALRERLANEDLEFNTLPLESRELLVDLSVFDGAESLSAEQIRAIAALEWEQILKPGFYARWIADWPDSDRNKAFFERWKR